MKKYCSRCKAEGLNTEADLQVKGTIYKEGASRSLPYKANLCSYHYTMLIENDAMLDVVKAFTDLGKKISGVGVL